MSGPASSWQAAPKASAKDERKAWSVASPPEPSSEALAKST